MLSLADILESLSFPQADGKFFTGVHLSNETDHTEPVLWTREPSVRPTPFTYIVVIHYRNLAASLSPCIWFAQPRPHLCPLMVFLLPRVNQDLLVSE